MNNTDTEVAPGVFPYECCVITAAEQNQQVAAEGSSSSLFFTCVVSYVRRVCSKNCTSARTRGSGGASVLLWCQQGSSHYTFIEFPKPPHDKES